MIYEKLKIGRNETEVIKATDENGKEYWIPIDESNSDYQAYLRYQAGDTGTLGTDAANQ